MDEKDTYEFLKQISEQLERFFPQSFRDNGLSISEGIMDYGKRHLRRIFETMNLIPKSSKKLKVLEIGIGRGILAMFVKRYFGYEVWGIDIERKDTKFLKPFFKHAGIHFVLCDITRDPLPFPDKSFDVVLFCEVLEHLRGDPLKVIKEVRRVLKDKGVLILTTPNLASLRKRLLLALGKSPHMLDFTKESYKTHFREYTVDELMNLLTNGGFNISKVYMSSCTVKNKLYKIVTYFLPRFRPTIMIMATKNVIS